MAKQMFDGFDHERYQDEVEQRWGEDAYAKGDAWWRSMSEEERSSWKRNTTQLSAEWAVAARSGIAPNSAEAQALAARHVRWLAEIPGTPASKPGADVKAYVTRLGELYVTDPRYAANYDQGRGGNEPMFVRDALRIYADEHL